MTDATPTFTPHRATPEQWDERIQTAFLQWWYLEGSGMPPLPGHDHEQHARRMTEIAWMNGAYVAANRLEQEAGPTSPKPAIVPKPQFPPPRVIPADWP